MLAREIMTSPVVTVESDLPIKEAARLLDKNDITSLPVVDDQQRLVGIVSEADLLRGEIAHDPRGHARPLADDKERPATVADVMTLGVITVNENTDAADIARLMLDTGVKSVPVTHGMRVVGIVSRRDLIRAIATRDDWIEDEIRQLFSDAGIKGWDVEVVDGEARLTGSGSRDDARVAAVLARTVAGVARVREAD
ncbi:MAG TPA: CBS domain-containing protein [Jiangellaceae bacterium]